LKRIFLLLMLVLAGLAQGCKTGMNRPFSGDVDAPASRSAAAISVFDGVWLQAPAGMVPGVDYIPNEIIVGFEDSANAGVWSQVPGGGPNLGVFVIPPSANIRLYKNADVAALARHIASKLGLTVLANQEAYVGKLNFCTYRLPPGLDARDAARKIKTLFPHSVRYIQYNQIFRAQFSPDDPKWVDGTLWAINKIDADLAWDTATGNGVSVAVIDSGIRQTHEDLAWQSFPGVNLDLVNEDELPEDQHGHGTHVSGTVGARGNNAKGVIGVGWECTLIPVKVLNSQGWAASGTTAAGIALAEQLGADVINMSIGSSYADRTSAEACRNAWDAGIVLVAAAGNESTWRPSYPGALPEVISVGATNTSDGKTGYSNYGKTVDIAAPGGSGSGSNQIYSTIRNGFSSYGNMQGTSMASPHVAGAAAVLRESNPALTPNEVRGLLEGLGDDVLNQGSWQGAVKLYRLNVNNAIGQTVADFPTVDFTSHNDGDSVSTQFTLVVNPQAANGLAGVHWYMDGEHMGWDNSAPWELTIDPVTMLPGPHTFTAEVLDDKNLHGYDRLELIFSLPSVDTPYLTNFQDPPNSDNWISLDYSGAGQWQEIGTEDVMLFLGDPAKSGGAGYYPDDVDALLTPNFDLRGLSQPALYFRSAFDLAANDYLLVRLVDDGGTDDLIGYQAGRNAEWPNLQPFSISLSRSVNQTARIEFWLYHNGTSAGAGGVYIDDVVVTEPSLPPVVNMTSPETNEVVFGTKLVAGTVTDDLDSLRRVDFVVDDLVLLSLTEPPFEWGWDTTAVPDGPHAVWIKAYDEMGVMGYASEGSNHVTAYVHNTPIELGDFAPSSGAIGLPVTITGTGFGDYVGGSGLPAPWHKSYVYFTGESGLVEAVVDPLDWSDTQINTTVPEGAVSGPITVAVGTLSDVSANSFTVGAISGFAFTSPPQMALITSDATFTLTPQPFATSVEFDILEAPGIPIPEDTTPDEISFGLDLVQFPGNGKFTLVATARTPTTQEQATLVFFVERLRGDFNADRFVTAADLDFLRLHIGETPESPEWLAYLDSDRNGVVDERDALAVGYNFASKL